jgi:hypothetical protein
MSVSPGASSRAMSVLVLLEICGGVGMLAKFKQPPSKAVQAWLLRQRLTRESLAAEPLFGAGAFALHRISSTPIYSVSMSPTD